MLEKPSNDEEDEEEGEKDEVTETLEEMTKDLFVHKNNEKAKVDTVDEDVLKHMQSLRFETFEEDKEEELIAEEEEWRVEEGFDDKDEIRDALASEVSSRKVLQNTRPSSTRSIHALRFDEEESTGAGKNGKRIIEEEEDDDDDDDETEEEEEKGKEKGLSDDENLIEGAFESEALLRTVILLFLFLLSVALPAYQFVT